MYIAEVSPPSIRGRLVGIYETGVQAGTFIGFWISYGVSQNIAPTSAQWQVQFAIQPIPGAMLVFGMFFLPESPRWTARVLGMEHPNTITNMANLAHTFYQQGLKEKAIQLMNGVVKSSKVTIGADHPNTILWVKDFEAWTQKT